MEGPTLVELFRDRFLSMAQYRDNALRCLSAIVNKGSFNISYRMLLCEKLRYLEMADSLTQTMPEGDTSPFYGILAESIAKLGMYTVDCTFRGMDLIALQKRVLSVAVPLMVKSSDI